MSSVFDPHHRSLDADRIRQRHEAIVGTLFDLFDLDVPAA